MQANTRGIAVEGSFFREVILAIERDGVFVLLDDDLNPVFRCQASGREKGLMPFLTALLPNYLRRVASSVSVQELVAEREQRSKHHDWVFEFERKYGMAQPCIHQTGGPVTYLAQEPGLPRHRPAGPGLRWDHPLVMHALGRFGG